MAESKAINGKRGWLFMAGSLLAGAIGGGGGSVWYVDSFGRPDPFYGEDGRRLVERIQRIETRLDTHFVTHPDRDLERRIIVLETLQER